MRDLGDERVSRNFAGSLLVAHPNMVDPNFRRTVLFVSEHEPNEGALGVIINRPLDRPVAELVSGYAAGGARRCAGVFGRSGWKKPTDVCGV